MNGLAAFWLVLIVILATLPYCNVYGFESIPITVSGTMDHVTFDGKWSFEKEWKASSLNTYDYDNGQQIILRTAHQKNFVYVLLEALTDNSLDTGNDYAIICFDTKNLKSSNPDKDDYCFMVKLGEQVGTTYVGGYLLNGTYHFEKLPNPDGYVAISSVSDKNDRYTPIPHPSYEFRIPTDVIGRESIYGFYFKVHDSKSNIDFTYPQNLHDDFVASPDQWGEIYSPDKSLPEFGFPIILLLISITGMLFVKQLKLFK
ncbi:MAG: hypothetical protein EB158_08840, partial [Nitrosopumilaceae archaeon]|nr:hypothetical protein [Nitrosopumilaceae archaeon]